MIKSILTTLGPQPLSDPSACMPCNCPSACKGKPEEYLAGYSQGYGEQCADEQAD